MRTSIFFWEEFWDTLHFIRLQLERPIRASFNASFEKLLPTRELLALPGMSSRTRVLGDDATMDRIGAVDWSQKRFLVDTTEQFTQALRRLLPADEHVEIISVMEPLASVFWFPEK